MSELIENPKENSSLHLKYPRRKRRTIGGETHYLDVPDEKRSKLMQRIRSNGTKPEQIIEKELLLNKIKFSKHLRITNLYVPLKSFLYKINKILHNFYTNTTELKMRTQYIPEFRGVYKNMGFYLRIFLEGINWSHFET